MLYTMLNIILFTCFLSAGNWFHSAAKTFVISENGKLGFSDRNCSRLSFKNRMYPKNKNRQNTFSFLIWIT